MRTVAGQHGVGAVCVVCAVRGRGRSHGCRALRVHRLRGRCRRRRGVGLLLNARLEAGPVVRVAAFLVLEPERSVVHAEHPGRLAETYAAVAHRVERAYKVLVRLRISRAFPFNRSLRAGAGALAVTGTLRRWRGAARRRVLQRPVRGGVRIVRKSATRTSRAGTRRVLIADGRGCCYFGRRKRRRRLDRQIRLTRGQSETWICVLHNSPWYSCRTDRLIFGQSTGIIIQSAEMPCAYTAQTKCDQVR